MILVASLITPFGTQKKERKKSGRALSTLLIRRNLPPIERVFCFEEDNFRLILAKIVCHKEDHLGFPPTGMPRKVKGGFVTLQFRIEANI